MLYMNSNTPIPKCKKRKKTKTPTQKTHNNHPNARIDLCSCQTDAPIIALKDPGETRVFYISNTNRATARIIDTDECMFMSSIRASDYVTEFPATVQIEQITYALYIELKGSSMVDAYDQLENTIKHFQDRHRHIEKEKRLSIIVGKKFPPSAQTRRQIFEATCKKKYKITPLPPKENEATYNIAYSEQNK